MNKIFFNTTADLSVLPKRTQNMLKYIESGETSDEDTEYIDSQVTEARTKEIWREEYMRTFVHDNDVYMDGYDTGYDTGAERTTVEFYLSSDITKQAAMKKLNYSEAEFDEVVAKYQNELVKN
ncbi:MAG: hypothetical protein MJZ11_08815 [Lachnospiraceae bacterium]|nr:hypothetical protein [Lachnospiraceae bacterium]